VRQPPLPEAAPSTSPTYAATWQADESLEELNERIHDGVPVDKLLDRARSYRDWLFGEFPEAAPGPGAAVMELGSGVGWIMQAMLEGYAFESITGLDISANMIKRAQERFSDPRACFVLYDGLTMPFPDGHFKVIYSVAAMQHIEKHAAFLLFEELHRCLAPGGHAIIHLLAVEHIPVAAVDYHTECLQHVHDEPTHWHHYYAFDELFVLFSEVIGASDLDLVYEEGSFLVHFSKGGANRYRRESLLAERHVARLAALAQPAVPAAQPAPEPVPVDYRDPRAWVPDALKPLARRLRRLVQSAWALRGGGGRRRPPTSTAP
jgi:ubiquinone/menaquinone biosynthesis C-methylase UbiE